MAFRVGACASRFCIRLKTYRKFSRKRSGDRLERFWHVGSHTSNPLSEPQQDPSVQALSTLSRRQTGAFIVGATQIYLPCSLQNFPFAVVSLNMTGICLKVLREAKLYSYIRKKKSVIQVVGTLHIALFYDMYLIWCVQFDIEMNSEDDNSFQLLTFRKNEGKTISQFPYVRDDLEARALKNPSAIISKYEKSNCNLLDEIAAKEEEFVPN